MKKSLRIFIFLILALSFLFSFRKNIFAQTLLTDIPKNIVILNPVSHPKTGNTWEIQFTTQGTNDLFISLEDQETLDDIEFKGLYCNDFKLYFPKVLTESTSFVNNYNCNGISTLKYLVHKAGDHTVGIQFGSEKEIAHNSGIFQWSKRLGGTSVDYGYGVTVDSSGNIIVTGVVSGLADLNGDGDSTDGGAENATGYGSYDIFISVFNSSGVNQWSKRLGGTSVDNGFGVTVDSSGNIIVTGYVAGAADLNGDGDSTDGGAESATGYGGNDIFISVFNSSGVNQWSKRLGGTSNDYGYGVTVDSSGNIVVTGSVTGAADLNGDGDSTDGGAENATGYGNYDIFISVFNSSGVNQWSKRLGGTSVDYGYGVTVDSSGNIVVTGSVTGAADLNGDGDSTDGGAENATGYGSYDIFISVFKQDFDSPTGSILINSNDSSTFNQNVSLTLSATDSLSTVTQMMICNDAAFTGCTWETYGTSKSWTVTNGYGTKTVYVKYMDDFGNISEVYSDSINYITQIYFSTGPAESTASTASSPNTIGTNIIFTGTAIDASSNGYYLIVCSTDSVTAGSGGASPTCGATTYCKNTTAVSSGTSTSCSYTTQATDSWSNTWYAFVCNNASSTPVCSSASQGTGDSGSPFFVNHVPTFTAVSNNSPQSPGSSLTWTSTASDSDTSATVKLLVCKTNAISGGVCSGGEWCSSELTSTNPTCSYTIASPTTVGTYSAYAFIVDEFGATASTGSRSSSFTVSNEAPNVTNVSLNSGNNITLSESTTTAITITATIVDSNGCESISSVYAYAYRSGVAYTGCDTAGEGNSNNCYPEITCSEYNNSCVDASDTTAVYTCSVNIKHYADSTTANTIYPTETWLASVKATDSGSSTYRAEVTVGVEMEALLGASVSSIINYGQVFVGDTIDPLSKEVVITSSGNVGLDHTISGLNLTCDDDLDCPGTPIPVTNQKYSLTGSTSYSTGTSLSTSAVALATHLAKQTTDTGTTKSLWWGIFLPTGIVPGTYDGLITITNVMSNTTDW